jgi:hypothetical protein
MHEKSLLHQLYYLPHRPSDSIYFCCHISQAMAVVTDTVHLKEKTAGFGAFCFCIVRYCLSG